MAPIPIKHRKATLYQYPKMKLTPAQLAQVRRLVVSKQEPKRYSVTGGVNMVDSSHYVVNPLYNIGEAVTGVGRVAQVFNLQEVCINYTVFLNQTPENVDLFVYAYWSDQETVTTSGVPTQITTPNVISTLPFIGAVTTNQSSLLQFDKFRCTPIRGQHIAINNEGPIGATQIQRYTGTVRMKFKDKKITYLADGASYLEGKNLYVGWVVSANGTIDTTATAALYQNTLVTFRE